MFSIVADAKECVGHNPAAAKANGAAVYICIVCTTAALPLPSMRIGSHMHTSMHPASFISKLPRERN